MRTRHLVSLASALCLVGAGLAPAPARATDPPKRWIVRYAPGSDLGAKARAARTRGAEVSHSYKSAVAGLAVEATSSEVAALGRDRQVLEVLPDQVVRTTGAQSNPGWALDRIDQRTGQSGWYTAHATGAGVPVYVLDSGIRASHTEFSGRVAAGVNTIDRARPRDTSDGLGHGTHVSALVAGTRHGVAKKAAIIPVKVVDNSGNGSTSSVLAGIEWVLSHHKDRTRAVANLSIGADDGDKLLDAAVNRMIAEGITVVTSAGNTGGDACSYSPGRVPGALTIGAVASGGTGKTNTRWPRSAQGRCVDLFAPGVQVLSAGRADDRASQLMTGTSMATPLASGAAALVLQARPTWTPAQVNSHLVSRATTGVVAQAGTGSPNRLLHTLSPITPGDIEFAPTPRIAGQAVVGRWLTVRPDAWGLAPVTRRYQWVRINRAGTAQVIKGATAPTYRPTASDRGWRLRVRVSGSKTDYAWLNRDSAFTAAVR